MKFHYLKILYTSSAASSTMRNLPKILTGVLLFFLFAATTTAEITSVKIQSDHRDVIDFKPFGFTQNGNVSITVSSASVTSSVTSSLSQPDPSRIGFFLISQDELFRFQREHLSCALDSKFISILFTFQELSNSSFNKSYAVTYPNTYTLRFANCNPITHVTMDVRTEFFNTDMNSPLYEASVDWGLLAFLVNLICIFAVFVAMCCCATYETKAARRYSEKLAPFRMVGLAYLIIDLILGVFVTFSNHWVSNATNEIIGLVFFYMVMLSMFWPLMEKIEYLVACVWDEDFDV